MTAGRGPKGSWPAFRGGDLLTSELERFEIDGPVGRLAGWTAGRELAGQRTPVLFIHPINTQGAIWKQIVPRLDPPRYCLLPDMRGHGGSDAHGPYGLENWTQDLLAVMDHFEVERAHAVGGSLGGPLAVVLAAAIPDRIVSVAGFGSSLNFEGMDGLESVLDTLQELGVQGMFQKVFPEITFGPDTDPAIIELALELANPNDVETVSAIWSATIKSDATDAAASVQCPALVVNGELDATCTPRLGLVMARRLSTNLVTMPDVAHMPMLESPEAVASMLNDHFANTERSWDDPRQEIGQLYQDWFGSIPRHDVAFFERVLASDFVYVDIFGAATDKRGYIGLVEAVTPDSVLEPGDMSVRRCGDVVIAHGHYTVRGFYDNGKDIGSHTRFTSGWTRRAGHWQALFHQATRIEDG